MGFDTPVVHAVNYEYRAIGGKKSENWSSGIANALNTPPGDYNRKVET